MLLIAPKKLAARDRRAIKTLQTLQTMPSDECYCKEDRLTRRALREIAPMVVGGGELLL
jgi:hypothetical protein